MKYEHFYQILFYKLSKKISRVFRNYILKILNILGSVWHNYHQNHKIIWKNYVIQTGNTVIATPDNFYKS